MNKRLLLVTLACLTLGVHAQRKAYNAPSAANPFIPGYFADPTIRKFGDTYYLYATTDGTGNGYGPAQVWVSKDFVNWKNIVMNWPTTEVVWAPDVVQQPDGTFRYYYCEPCMISIGESTSPIGPWKNILGQANAVMVPDVKNGDVVAADFVLSNLGVNTNDEWLAHANAQTVWGQATTNTDGVALSQMAFSQGTMPSVEGMGARDAVFLLEQLGLRVHIRGTGRVRSQSIPQGLPIGEGMTCELALGN